MTEGLGLQGIARGGGALEHGARDCAIEDSSRATICGPQEREESFPFVDAANTANLHLQLLITTPSTNGVCHFPERSFVACDRYTDTRHSLRCTWLHLPSLCDFGYRSITDGRAFPPQTFCCAGYPSVEFEAEDLR